MTTPLHTLYAYVDGADLDDVAEILDARFEQFVSSHPWRCGEAWVVNQQHGQETCTHPDDLPLWDLGLNLPLPDPGTEPADWFSDIEAIVCFLMTLNAETHREFVIGICNSRSQITEDLFLVGSVTPDMQELHAMLAGPSQHQEG